MFEYKKHVFVCENIRPADSPKKSCGAQGGIEIRARMKELIQNMGLQGKIRINSAGCLGKCNFGPMLVIYPAGIWYAGVRISDVEEIIQKSVLQDEIIERLVLRENNEKTDSA